MAIEHFIKVENEASPVTREKLILAQSIMHRWDKYSFDMIRRLFNGGHFECQFAEEPTTKTERAKYGDREFLYVSGAQVAKEIQEICMIFIHKASQQMPEEIWDEFSSKLQKSTENSTN